MDYRNTLNLPKTGFPMKANLPEREPNWLVAWEEEGLYQRQRNLRHGRPKFILHDGPPYANGDIHTGTALNKVLKDMINRLWNLEGYDVVYVPGWDTHGLPIEMRALKKLGLSQHQIDPVALRQECSGVARHYIGVMTEEFQRLGVMGDWSNPYVTMNPAYEGAELNVFADMVERNLIYRDLKSVYWCPHCETALAEGEIEYQEHESDSIYVQFIIEHPEDYAMPEGTGAVIWTTTPWTIPANVAIAVNPQLPYVVVTTEKGSFLLAEHLVDRVLATLGLSNLGQKGPWLGSALEGIKTRHPYLGHEVPIILGDHVTEESGTGLVHTAPGHGVEDFEVGRQYHLPVVQPLDDQGRYYAGTPLVEGLFYQDANPVVNAELARHGALLHAEKFRHQYAFCWRCKNPVIFRATSQWFMSIDKLREQLVEATYPVHWEPEWGGDRMRRMVLDRQDWCLSRQRVWGLPIPAFYCQDCGQVILDAPLIRHVATIIGKEGSDSWWSHPADHFLPQDFVCPNCHGTHLRQEMDIFDVWMDSGSSQAAVLADHPGLEWPADVVLEGNDQYRGWFNSLLTTGVSTRGRAPYKMVLTHGMVLDKSGQEMHKSLGNTIDPMDIIHRYGADILRLWVATSDYRSDVRISDEILTQLSETYRKIRNTFRFLLGNLSDYRQERPVSVTDPMNRWAIATVNQWIAQARDSYRQYIFHPVVHDLVRLMTIDLSSFYLDVIKDRLYTLAPQDPLRRETQSVLNYILQGLVRGISPVLVFTADEVYRESLQWESGPPSVHLTEWDTLWDIGWTMPEASMMDRLLSYRGVILKALESLRADKVIGNSLQAMVELTLPPEEGLTDSERSLLLEMVLAADIQVVSGRSGEILARANATDWNRCDRCWRYTPEVGANPDHPDLCSRCIEVLHILGV
ncbi:MAG: isoleucine--tRNA ligase [Sulfobacillus benefaciens]|uniref:Isoleucine--tRNA ligase n=1 Tax=Sulfobacillus benefaciens TaxID=453960 RepID=A0A2T2XFH2_9FIRM|nr:MAG: isoleucine--tRNA ligase [Sulfobacillus benefaciens]